MNEVGRTDQDLARMMAILSAVLVAEDRGDVRPDLILEDILCLRDLLLELQCLRGVLEDMRWRQLLEGH